MGETEPIGLRGGLGKAHFLQELTQVPKRDAGFLHGSSPRGARMAAFRRAKCRIAISFRRLAVGIASVVVLPLSLPNACSPAKCSWIESQHAQSLAASYITKITG